MLEIEAIRDSLAPLVLAESELRDLSRALTSPPRQAIRARPGLDRSSLPFPTEPVPWFSRGHFVAEETRPGACLAYAAGDYYIQDASSLLAVAAIGVQPSECVCDLCAAPGGKATAIAEWIGDEGWLLANETIGSRIAPLCLNLARQGTTRFVVSQSDPDRIADLMGARFDTVLVDAPCSGQSLVSRKRQTKSSFAARAIDHCAARQARILQAAARLVRPEGRLVYSTCTFAHAENEGQVEAFLANHLDFHLEPCSSLANWASEAMPNTYRLWPHRHGCGGAFAAVLRRAGNDSAVALLQHGDMPKRKGRLAPASLPAEVSEWGTLVVPAVWAQSDQCFGWPRKLWDPLATVARAGPEVAFRKGKTWSPAFALAMRRDVNWNPRQTVDLDDEAATDYVQGLPVLCTQRGWAVATWNGRPLGWLKGDGHRGKNHLPKPARLSIVRP